MVEARHNNRVKEQQLTIFYCFIRVEMAEEVSNKQVILRDYESGTVKIASSIGLQSSFAQKPPLVP